MLINCGKFVTFITPTSYNDKLSMQGIMIKYIAFVQFTVYGVHDH